MVKKVEIDEGVRVDLEEVRRRIRALLERGESVSDDVLFMCSEFEELVEELDAVLEASR